jgi:hypothetical protein
MGDLVKTVALTNSREKSCVDVHCDCNGMWSIVQQFSTIRMCELLGKGKGKYCRPIALEPSELQRPMLAFTWKPKTVAIPTSKDGTTGWPGRVCQ